MTTENNTQTQPQSPAPVTKGPLDTFKNGAVTVDLWPHTDREGHTHVNMSIGKLYKDQQGQWQKGNSFGANDIIKLQSLIPRVMAKASVHEHVFNAERLERQNTQQQVQQIEPQVTQTQQLAATKPQQPIYQNMATQRDQAMQQAQPMQSPQQNTQEHAPTQHPSR